MILSDALLAPSSHQIQNPFSSMVETVERWLNIHDKSYLESTWINVKYAYVQRLLGSKNGSLLRGFSQRASNPELASALLSMYQTLDYSFYYTSKFWRAFFYYLKKDKLDLNTWPQFGEHELFTVLSILTEDDISNYKLKAKEDWPEIEDQKFLNDFFKKIKNPLRNLCKHRESYFKYESSVSWEDLEALSNIKILKALRKGEYNPKKEKIIGWALKCADNAIHNYHYKLTKHYPTINASTTEHKTYSLSQTQGDEDHQDISLIDTISVLGGDAFNLTDEMENNFLVKELITQADSKIGSYLKVVCCGEHDPDFWAWFYHNEPTLAQRISYTEENPETIAPYLQRHLKLPTHQLLNFLKERLPDLLMKLDIPHNREKIARSFDGTGSCF